LFPTTDLIVGHNKQMINWLRKFLIGPHVLVFSGIIFTLIAELLRYIGDKREKVKLENIGMIILIIGLLISGFGGWWAAWEQSNFEQKILGSVTGGDSYCYILPLIDESSGRTTFMLMHDGEYPVYNIYLTISDETKMATLPFNKLIPIGDMKKEEWETLNQERDVYAEFMQLRSTAISKFELPILTKGIGHTLVRFQIPKELNDQKYFVQIFSRNGIFNQEILCRRIDGLWRNSFRITTKSLTNNKTIILKEQIHLKIPIDDT
jgi:hypothetical protein